VETWYYTPLCYTDHYIIDYKFFNP
jgi:hypothetical protein